MGKRDILLISSTLVGGKLASLTSESREKSYFLLHQLLPLLVIGILWGLSFDFLSQRRTNAYDYMTI